MSNSEPLALSDVPKRPVFYATLGEFFRELRTAKGLGLRQAVSIAQGKGLRVLTKQALFGLEKGQTKNADPDVLRAVATLYEVPYPWVLANFIGHKYGLGIHADAGKELLRITDDFDRTAVPRGFVAKPDEIELIELWRALTPRSKSSLLSIIHDLLPKKAKHRRAS